MNIGRLWNKVIPPIAFGIVGGVIGALILGVLAYNHETRRAGRIPLGFSEIAQLEREAAEQGVLKENPDNTQHKGMSRTLYLAGLNDLTMKVFECWNDANEEGSDPYAQFAQNLENRLDPQKKQFHYELEDLFVLVTEAADAIVSDFEEFSSASGQLSSAVGLLESSWTERHKDHTHTEWYSDTESYTDSQGHHKTRTVRKSRTVYDYTDHDFFYYPHVGHQAADVLMRVVAIPNVVPLERVITVNNIQDENRRAAQESRSERGEVIQLSKDDLVKIVHTWCDGATLLRQQQEIADLWRNLTAQASEWNTLKSTSKNFYERTRSRTHRGPRGYQVVQNSIETCKKISQVANDMFADIRFIRSGVIDLRTKIHSFVHDVDIEGDYKRSGEAVLDKTVELYCKAFEKGFEVDRFRYSFLVGGVLIGLIGGGLFGRFCIPFILKILSAVGTYE